MAQIDREKQASMTLNLYRQYETKLDRKNMRQTQTDIQKIQRKNCKEPQFCTPCHQITYEENKKKKKNETVNTIFTLTQKSTQYYTHTHSQTH